MLLNAICDSLCLLHVPVTAHFGAAMQSRHPAFLFALSQFILLAPYPLRAQEAARTLEALPEHLLYQYTSQELKPANPDTPSQVTVVSAQQWENGRTLRVCMFAGNPTVAALIADVAGEWNRYSGVRLDFGREHGGYNCLSPASGHFQIRIGFSERGYWSTMGSDSETLLNALVPSMNLNQFNMKYSVAKFSADEVATKADPYDRAVIRHEFGHALGLAHELQHPTAGCYDEIKWEGLDNVYTYFAGPPNNWEPDKVIVNLGFGSKGKLKGGKFDKDSVMKYWLPARVLKQGAQSPCYSEVNYEISALDKEAIAGMYPPGVQPAPMGELSIVGAPVTALPRMASAPTRDDALARVTVDLESTEPFIRRDARARLADLVPITSAGELDAVIAKMRRGSYRYKLGVAVALASQRSKPALSIKARAILSEELKAAKDATLKSNLRKANRL